MADKFTFEPIDDETKEARKKIYPGEATAMVDMVWVKPTNLFMTKNFQFLLDEIMKFEVREDDIWMVTYPKAGSTLVQVCYISILLNACVVQGRSADCYHKSIKTTTAFLCSNKFFLGVCLRKQERDKQDLMT